MKNLLMFTLRSCYFFAFLFLKFSQSFKFHQSVLQFQNRYKLTRSSAISSAKPILDGIVTVDLDQRSYPIYIGNNILSKQNILLKHISSKKVLIVTNTKVGPIYSAKIKNILSSEIKGVEIFEVVLPDGEEFKTIEVLMKIIDAAMTSKLDRKSTMIALGGGVIGDMTGFAAAIYQRGINFIQIPTSLMAMVDSAVGGKTAVNHPQGKNMIGAFYQPEAVIVDIHTLSTLEDREFKSGLSEVIKYGLIGDFNFFLWLEDNMDSILNRDRGALFEIIRRSCKIKAAIVAADEKESSGGRRATLNFGHTFGHAVESGLGYGLWLHGEAVSVGMAMAADFSLAMGWITGPLVTRIKNLLVKADLPITLDNRYVVEDIGADRYLEILHAFKIDDFLELMSMDKKVDNGNLNLILLQNGWGDLGIVTDKYDKALLKEVVQKYLK